MKLELKVLLMEYETRSKKLRKNVKDADKAENLANYELGRLHEINKVISELSKVCEKYCL